jgi:hypothetical protein
MTAEIYDDPAAMTADPGLVHLASQIVQLLWLESANHGIPPFSGAARQKLLSRAGSLLKLLAQHVDDRQPATEWGALPSPAALETSTCLLEALREAGLPPSSRIDELLLGDEHYGVVQDKLLKGEIPSVAARDKLMDVFSALADVAARREYRSPLHDNA